MDKISILSYFYISNFDYHYFQRMINLVDTSIFIMNIICNVYEKIHEK
jgi:hypothetical protein